jgi:hypothetical protein
MLSKEERIRALLGLGDWVGSNQIREQIFSKAEQENRFFIPDFVEKAVQSILTWLSKENLEAWLGKIPSTTEAKKVGLVLAGNIPLVGFHDLLAVFSTGHKAVYKPSSQDKVLIDWLLTGLTEVEPRASEYFQKTDSLKNVDALMATGSSNTAAHFDYYFRHLPRLIRGSRSSLGIFFGFETAQELEGLCDDVMLYFGLGCRNVTKILVPTGYDFHPFFQALEKYRYLTDHHKFQNNAIYHKSIFLMNGDPFLDNDILMLRKNESLFSPMAVLNYMEYESLEQAKSIVESHAIELQCLVSFQGKWENSIPFGMAQSPKIEDYADGENTLSFLSNL